MKNCVYIAVFLIASAIFFTSTNARNNVAGGTISNVGQLDMNGMYGSETSNFRTSAGQKPKKCPKSKESKESRPDSDERNSEESSEDDCN
ncbi:hypothetical protein SNE40_016087 [Patella caerulea]|uniref:Uncharacterized protein n=1 Tax=Patella caerulea TaxID=87958 RepID=A0AAN8PBI7_PATCE